MNSTLPLRKNRDFGEKVSDTVRFIKLNWKNLLIMYGLFVLPFLLVAVLLGAGYFMDIFTQIRGNGLQQLFQGWKLIVAAILLFLAINMMAAYVYVYMDLWEKKDEMPTVTDVARKIMKPFLTNIMYSFILFLFIMAVCLAVVLIISAFGRSAGVMALMVLLLFLGFIFFSAYFILVYPANTIGGNEFGSPIRAAWILLRNNWWPSLGYVMVLGLIYYIFSFITQMVLTMVFGISTLLNPEQTTMASGKGMAVVYGLSILIQQLFYLVIFVGSGILYYTLHEEKVGTGLESRIEEIGSKQTGSSQQEEY